MEPAEPMARIDPADPIDRMDPADPIDRIDPADPIERIEPTDVEAVTSSSRGSWSTSPAAIAPC